MRLAVLHISPKPPQIGGMETYMGDLLQSSLRQQVTLYLVDISKPALQTGGKYAIRTGYVGILERGLRRSLISYKYSAGFFYQFLKILHSKKISIVHIHTASYSSFWEKCLYILTGRITGKKIVLHMHGALFDVFYRDSSFFSKALIRFFLLRCHTIIVLSRSWLTFFKSILPTANLRVVENGINLKPFISIEGMSKTTSFLHIGEISRRKGVEDVLDVFSQIKQEGFAFHLHLAGGGELNRISQMINELGLQEHVTVHGPTRGEKKTALFAVSDVFVLASYAEGLPIAIIEALAAGLPVISTTVGGIPDVIQNEVHGFLCAPGEKNKLKEYFIKMINNPLLGRKIGEDNRLYAQNRFNIERCAAQIVDIYRSISA
jgi:glycosyltransferase involved in cell wall biosynthesis